MQIQMETGTCMLGLQRARLYWEWRPCRWWMVTTLFHLMKWLLKLKRAKMTRGDGVLCLRKKKKLHRILPRRHELTTPFWTSLIFSMKMYLIVKQLDSHFGKMLCFFVIEPMPSLSQSSSDVQLSWETKNSNALVWRCQNCVVGAGKTFACGAVFILFICFWEQQHMAEKKCYENFYAEMRIPESKGEKLWKLF